jgi:predicted uridylate kinase
MGKGIICISLGGSIFFGKDGINVEYLKQFKSLLLKHKEEKFIISVGGGSPCRSYISEAKNIIDNNFVLDRIGVMFTKTNALLLRNFLANSINMVYTEDINEISEINTILERSRVIVIGGIGIPGTTTDTTAVLSAEAIGLRKVINVSTESYVFDRNPKEKNAKKFVRLSHMSLVKLASEFDNRDAGTNFIFDIIACKLAKRSNIDLWFINSDIRNLESAINGKNANGTIVKG